MPGHWLSTSFLPHIEEISVRLILSLWYTAKAAQIELRHQISFLLSLSGSHLFNAYKKGETQQYLIKYPLIHLLLWIKGILYKGQKKKRCKQLEIHTGGNLKQREFLKLFHVSDCLDTLIRLIRCSQRQGQFPKFQANCPGKISSLHIFPWRHPISFLIFWATVLAHGS